jgi:hypothetical protein
MAFRICHNDNHALVVVVAFTGRRATELDDLHLGVLNVVDGDVEVDPHLAGCRLGHWLEHQSRLGVIPFAEVDPIILRRSVFAAGRVLQNRATRSGSMQSIVTPDHTCTTRTILADRRAPRAPHGPELGSSSTAVPIGVAVCDAMHDGGPWPATRACRAPRSAPVPSTVSCVLWPSRASRTS